MTAKGFGQTIINNEAGYSKFRVLCRTRFKININVQRGVKIREEDNNKKLKKTQTLD